MTAASTTSGQAINWANNTAHLAPSMRTEIPGPRSMDVARRSLAHDFGTTLFHRVPLAFAEGHGVTLTDVDGNVYLDMSHGHMVAGLGHGNPEIVDRVHTEMSRLSNVRDFPGVTRTILMERLAEITPGDLNLFKFYSSGTEAAEASMRVARIVTGGHEFVSFYGDYHGRSVGSMSTSDMSSVLDLGPRPSGALSVASGYCHRCEFKLEASTCGLHCLSFAEKAIEANGGGALAGIVLEPVTNGSGARVYPPGYLTELRNIADRTESMLIFDEHASGLGRTGTWFAGDREDVTPDIMYFSKFLGNGFPITVVATRELYRDELSTISQSSSFGGQPGACAAALAVLDVMQRDDLVSHAKALGEVCLARMREMQQRHTKLLGDARGVGLMLAFEVVDPDTGLPSQDLTVALYEACLRRGVVVSYGREALRFSPMLVTAESVALRGLDLVEEAISDLEATLGIG